MIIQSFYNLLLQYCMPHSIIQNMNEIFANQVLELRRGTIVLAILSTLSQPRYGYGLLQALDDAGVAVDAGTLYPMLRRLEKQEVLLSEWDTSESRPRKYYKLSDNGQKLYAKLLAEWRQTQNNLDKMISKEKI